ncbi:MAG: hypothetical protein QOH01_649 [Verrucomicrobiota bacterium]|jgi:hypothetical protein
MAVSLFIQRRRFGVEDIAAIRSFGEPAWLLDATLMHDTFAKEGRAALPELPYLAPAGFAEVSGIPTALLSLAPPEWGDEIEVIKIEGTRKNEHALFHRHSRTLVVADLFFSMPRRREAGRVSLPAILCGCHDCLGSALSFGSSLTTDRALSAR